MKKTRTLGALITLVTLAGCGGGDDGDTIIVDQGKWDSVGPALFYTDGNVGIGQDTPIRALHVTSTGNPQLRLQSGAAGFWEMWGGINFEVREGDMDQRFVIRSGGNVGIGTNNPLSKLAVTDLPTSPPDASGAAGVVCVTNNGNFWLDDDGTADCL